MTLETIGAQILERLSDKHERREDVLTAARRLTQHAAVAIRAVHRGELAEADAVLEAARGLLDGMAAAVADHSDLESAGYTLDAQKEYAEAWLTRALVAGTSLPAPEDLGVDDAAWLNGLGEAAGELRRSALDAIRAGDLVLAERLLEHMDEIHTYLSTVDFPAAITRNLKRTNDMVRGVTERTRGDLTIAARQEALRRALESAEARFGAAG